MTNTEAEQNLFGSEDLEAMGFSQKLHLVRAPFYLVNGARSTTCRLKAGNEWLDVLLEEDGVVYSRTKLPRSDKEYCRERLNLITQGKTAKDRHWNDILEVL